MPQGIPAPPPDASVTLRGLVNTMAQTYAGMKSFQDGIAPSIITPYSGNTVTVQNADSTGTLLPLTLNNTASSFAVSGVAINLRGTQYGGVYAYGSNAFGLVDGVNLSAIPGKRIGFRIGTTSGNVGYFDSGGFTSIGTIAAGGTITSTSGGFVFPDATTQTTAASGNLSGTGTAGNVPFFTGSTTLADASQLFWNDTNHWLGVNVSTNTSGYTPSIMVDGGSIIVLDGWGVEVLGDGNVDSASYQLLDGSDNPHGIWELGTNNSMLWFSGASDGSGHIGFRMSTGTVFTTGDLLTIENDTSVAWRFGLSAVTFPDNTVQTTAFTGSGSGGVVSLNAVGSSPNANAGTISGTTLTLQPASASFPGVLSSSFFSLLNGATSSSTASTLMQRDSSVNAQLNSLIYGFATTATAAGTTTLTVASAYTQVFTGSTTQTVVLPDATTLVVGQAFRIVNRSSGTVTVNKNGGSLVLAVTGGNEAIFTVTAIGTSAGSWDAGLPSISGGITALTGDVTASGTGSVAATVALVGGSSASAVNTATVLANNATASATASQIALRDANANARFNNLINGYTTTATAAGTTVLTVGSTWEQRFTGGTTQSCQLPDCTTLVLGQEFMIVNRSTGAVTVRDAGSNSLGVLTTNSVCIFKCVSVGSANGTWEVNSGISILAAVGASPNSNGASITGIQLTLQPADGSNPGLITAGTQTFGGAKTFGGAALPVNISSNDSSGTFATLQITNNAGSNGTPGIQFIHGGNDAGNIVGWGTTDNFGNIHGINLYSASNKIGFRIGSTSVANVSSGGMFVTSGGLAVGTTTVPQGVAWFQKSTSGGLGGDVWVANSASSALNSECSFSWGSDGTTDATPNARMSSIVTNAGSFLSDLVVKMYDGSALNEKWRFTSGSGGSVGNFYGQEGAKLGLNGSGLTTFLKADTTSHGLTFGSNVTNSGSNVAYLFQTAGSISGSTLIADFQNNTTSKFNIDNAGNTTATGIATSAGATNSSAAIWSKRTTVADADKTVAASDHYVSYTSITAARAVTLPSSTLGLEIVVLDESGSCSVVNTITVSTVSGGSTVINSAYGFARFWANGSAWFRVG